MIFSFDKSTSLEGGSEKKNPEMIRGGFKKMKGKNKEIIIAHPLDKLWMLPKRSIAHTLPVFLSSCSFSLFFFLLLAAFFVGQLLVKIKRAWTSSVSLQVIPVTFSSWRIFALCLHKSARPVCLSWIFYWLWILDDQGHSGLQLSGSMHLLFPCFYKKIGRVP